MGSLANEVQSVRKLKPLIESITNLIAIADAVETAQSEAEGIKAAAVKALSDAEKVKESAVEAKKLADKKLEEAKAKATAIAAQADEKVQKIIGNAQDIADKTIADATAKLSEAKTEVVKLHNETVSLKAAIAELTAAQKAEEAKLQSIRAAIAKATGI